MVLLLSKRKLLRDENKMAEEAGDGYKTVGYMRFLFEAYKCKFFLFEIVECIRRLLLASVVGIVSPGTPANAVVGLLICLVFLFVFIKFAPFVDSYDNITGVILAYSLTLLFLAALMEKVNATSQDRSDQRIYGICLIIILAWGPASILCQWCVSLCRHFRVKKARCQEKPPRQSPDRTRKHVSFYQTQSEDFSDFDDQLE
jgi:hypothetical protein